MFTEFIGYYTDETMLVNINSIEMLMPGETFDECMLYLTNSDDEYHVRGNYLQLKKQIREVLNNVLAD